MKEIVSKISFVNAFAFFLVGMIFAYFFAITFYSQPETMREASEIKTALIATLTAVVGYIYGSSRSSKARDEVVNTAINAGMAANTTSTPPVTPT